MTRIDAATLAALLASLLLSGGAGAAPVARPVTSPAAIQTGVLTCEVAGGVGLVLGSSKDVTCRFDSVTGGREVYTGSMTRIGLDLGITTGGRMVWAVFEPGAHRSGLGGTYVGATAQATVVGGLGANALIGGSNRAVALQPVSFEGQVGLNVAAGFGGLTIARAD